MIDVWIIYCIPREIQRSKTMAAMLVKFIETSLTMAPLEIVQYPACVATPYSLDYNHCKVRGYE